MVDKKILDKIVWDSWSKNKTAEIKPSGLDFVMDTMPFKAIFKRSVQDEKPFSYEAEGKSISFKPSGMWWATPQGNTTVRAVTPSVGSLVDGKLKYPSALGNDIDIECSTEKTMWRKEIIIKSLQSLGTIPIDAEYLEIGFEIETDFDIEVWDKQSELKFNTAFKLSELSQLESVKTWDNHIIPEPKAEEKPEALFERHDGFLREKDGKYFLVKRIPAKYLRDAIYPVITDIAIAFGAEYPFSESVGETVEIACAALDETHFVVVYEYSSQGYAKIGVVTERTIAFGAEYALGFNPRNQEVAVLDATHFVVVFGDSGDSVHGKARIGVVTGDAIAYGTAVEYNNDRSYYNSVSALDATHFVVVHQDQSPYYGFSKIGVVTGDAIVFGNKKDFKSGWIRWATVVALDATHFAVAFEDDGGTTYGRAKIGVVSSGNVINYGTEVQFIGSEPEIIHLARLDDTHFVIAWEDAGDGRKGKSIVGVVSGGNTVAFGPVNTFTENQSWYHDVSALDATTFVLTYRDGYLGASAQAKIGIVTGNVIAYGDPYEFNAGSIVIVNCAAFNNRYFVVVFEDTAGDDYGIAMIGEVPVFELTGVTKDKDGNVKANCECFLCKDNLDNTASFIAYIQSDGSGNYTFVEIMDEDAQYFVISWKDDTPHVFDVTDHVLQPALP